MAKRFRLTLTLMLPRVIIWVLFLLHIPARLWVEVVAAVAAAIF